MERPVCEKPAPRAPNAQAVWQCGRHPDLPLNRLDDRFNYPPMPATIIGAHDARTRLAELLDRVERGEEIVITRHGP